MFDKNKLENYMIDLSLSYQQKGDNMYIISKPEEGLENIVILIEDPIIVIRVKLMDIPKKNREEFYKTLLSLNASDLVHGAFALEGENVILIDTLEAETLDFEELQASLDAISLAISQHYEKLAAYR